MSHICEFSQRIAPEEDEIFEDESLEDKLEKIKKLEELLDEVEGFFCGGIPSVLFFQMDLRAVAQRFLDLEKFVRPDLDDGKWPAEHDLKGHSQTIKACQHLYKLIKKVIFN